MDYEQSKRNYAQVLQGQTLSKPEALWYFGNEGEIKNYFKGDKHRFTGNTAKSFLKTLNQYFETVDDTVKIGRAKGYKLGAARINFIKREDNREINGEWKESTKHLDALILSQLEYNITQGYNVEHTVIDWMHEFNMVNENSYFLYKSKFDSFNRKKVENLIETKGNVQHQNDIDKLYNFLYIDVRNQTQVFNTCLKRMKKEGIIETFDRPKAYVLFEGEEKPRKIDINMKLYQIIKDTDRDMKNQFNVTKKQIENYNFEKAEVKRRIEEYNKWFYIFLCDIEIEERHGVFKKAEIMNTWMELAIIVKATKKKTISYLHKYHSDLLKDYQDYKEEKFLSNRAIDYSKGRKQERLNSATKIKDDYIIRQKEKDKLAKEREDSLSWGTSGYVPRRHENRARLSKEVFLQAIETLDDIFCDNFLIDEEEIKKNIKKRP